MGDRAVIYQAPLLWNHLPVWVQEADALSTFRVGSELSSLIKFLVRAGLGGPGLSLFFLPSPHLSPLSLPFPSSQPNQSRGSFSLQCYQVPKVCLCVAAAEVTLFIQSGNNAPPPKISYDLMGKHM